MRKVTSEIVKAFYAGDTVKIDNSSTIGKRLFLHGNQIAEIKDGALWVTSAGWKSNTTKERLNGLNGVSINQKAGVWYLNGKPWGGEWVNLNAWDDKEIACDTCDQVQGGLFYNGECKRCSHNS